MANVLVETLARQVLADIDTDVGFLTAIRWISDRNKQLGARFPLRRDRKIGEVVVPGVYEVGTLTATQGSASLVGVATAWTSVLEGRFIRVSSAWYEILTVVGVTSITLTNTYTEPTIAGSLYEIVPRRVPLVAGVRRIISFRDTELGTLLRLVSPYELDYIAPQRDIVGSPPHYVVNLGYVAPSAATDARQIEVYPYPQDATLLTYHYYQEPPTLVRGSYIPDNIDPEVLKEGARVDLYRFLMGRAAKSGSMEMAAFWRNESRAQETQWEKRMQEAAITDMGNDEASMILQLGHDDGHDRGLPYQRGY